MYALALSIDFSCALFFKDTKYACQKQKQILKYWNIYHKTCKTDTYS